MDERIRFCLRCKPDQPLNLAIYYCPGGCKGHWIETHLASHPKGSIKVRGIDRDLMEFDPQN